MKRISAKAFNYFRDFIRVLLIVLIFSTIFNFWYINQLRDYDQQYITHSNEVRVLLQEVSKYAIDAVAKVNETSFNNLKNVFAKTNEELLILKDGKKSNGNTVLPPSPTEIKTDELARFSDTWSLIKPKIELILNKKELIISLGKLSEKLIDNVKKIQENYWSLLKDLGKGTTENNKIIMLTYQLDATKTIVTDIQKILNLSEHNSELKKLFMEKISSFYNNAVLLKTETTDPNYAARFAEITKLMQEVQDDIEFINKMNDDMIKVQGAIFEIQNIIPLASNLAKNLEDAYVAYPKSNTGADLSAYLLGLLSFLVLILSISMFHKESQSHIKMAEDKNKAMQFEVEKLLKELPDVANGNPPVELSDQDSARNFSLIPESFSYALSTLRKLVHNIGKTAKNVSMAASDAQKITKELAASSGQQAQEIVEVTASVNAMAASIEQVSANASESASVALESVNIAGEGGKVVRSTISGMERIQTQIQETSNYMRRLSDSSQEIGEIVSLIDGIADQTNILSLNASIQAAMAGEAGRGFAVVADEVQRLAEKVSYATKEIGSLVRSIQTDTNQVIVAMEQTKEQVLEGVNSAQDAGSTLEKIETVSRRLSDLIQNISSSASEQAVVSGKISNIMNDVKDIAKQTASGTMTTVDLIGNLMQFVTGLRNSVFEFKLPDDSTKAPSA